MKYLSKIFRYYYPGQYIDAGPLSEAWGALPGAGPWHHGWIDGLEKSQDSAVFLRIERRYRAPGRREKTGHRNAQNLPKTYRNRRFSISEVRLRQSRSATRSAGLWKAGSAPAR